MRRRANRLIATVNALVTARCSSSISTSVGAVPTAAQEASTTRLVKASAAYGTAEGWSPREAFEATIKPSDMYSLEQRQFALIAERSSR